MKIDKKLIKELSDYLTEFKLTELEYGENGKKIKVSRNSNPVSYQIDNQFSKNDNKASPEQRNSGKDITLSNYRYRLSRSRTWGQKIC